MPEMPPKWFLALEVPGLLVLWRRGPAGAGTMVLMPSAPVGALERGVRAAKGSASR